MLSLKLYNSKPGSPLQPAPGPACDQCRRRKARCNRQQPCQACKRGETICSYDAVLKARGRRPRIRSRTESADSRGSMKTSDIRVWDTDVPVPTIDATLEIMSNSSTTTQPRILTDAPDLIPPPAMEPECIQECNIVQDFDKASSDGTSPISLQRQPTVDSYLSEKISTPKYPHAEGSDSGLWASSEGVADFLHPSLLMLPRSAFLPYVRIFFERLYAVFPVIDREYLLALLQPDECQEQPLPAGHYAFLAALSAAVIVQLNVADLETPETQGSTFDDDENDPRSILNFRPAFSAQFFVAQCMQARQQRDFIEEPDEWTVLTSFFLFAYYGNLDQSRSAWYYLREAIGFIQALGLDESDTYIGVETGTAQRRRRIFWLLFITERAYAIQHRRRAILRPTIDLPRVFESQDPKLAYGFVTLAKVFAAVDEPFIAAWREQPPSGTASTSEKASQSIARFLRHSDVEGVLSEIEETQRLDIVVTHYWLRVLVCQLQIGISPQSVSISEESNTRCVLDTSRSLLQLISTASSVSLESHGIGMEQKVSDVANCLCDILAGLSANEFATDFYSAPDFLHNFMVFLAGFRSHESQYLRPLAQKATTVLAARLHPSSFPVTAEGQMMDDKALSYEDESRWTKV